ncbi:MAG: hydrogenase [Desulfuromonas sp.]|nr:MAG: hydrogenase [Desulfuromonas sp.]
MMPGYTETILKYASDDTHTGILENADGTGEVGLSGKDVGKKLAVRFTLHTAENRIKKIRFQVFGCGFTIAACAAVAEIAEGITLADATHIDTWAINNRLKGLPEERSYCAKLAADALQAALASVQNHARPVATTQSVMHEETGARINPQDPLYLQLLDSGGTAYDLVDCQMFAGLLTVASHEAGPVHAAVGLDEDSLRALLTRYFPGFDRSFLAVTGPKKSSTGRDINRDVLGILLSHVPNDTTQSRRQTSEWLARIIAARTAQPGHLWTSMGFFERPRLTEAIRRHLPALAMANNQGMRWKRYLFKQVCDLNGGMMCKSPNCGDCSDYRLCFAEED